LLIWNTKSRCIQLLSSNPFVVASLFAPDCCVRTLVPPSHCQSSHRQSRRGLLCYHHFYGHRYTSNQMNAIYMYQPIRPPLLLSTMLPCSLLPRLPATQPLQLQVLTYCDDFVEYSLYHDENEMNRLIERTVMNTTDRRIEGNHKTEETNQGSTDRDETKTDSSKSKASQKGKQRRKEQEFKEYTRIYIYQHDRYKKSRKRASRQANKRKTKDGKFLEGPAKDDDTYMSSNSSASEWERVGQPAEPRRTARKAAMKYQGKRQQ
jgi:hypothetical protein